MVRDLLYLSLIIARLQWCIKFGVAVKAMITLLRHQCKIAEKKCYNRTQPVHWFADGVDVFHSMTETIRAKPVDFFFFFHLLQQMAGPLKLFPLYHQLNAADSSCPDGNNGGGGFVAQPALYACVFQATQNNVCINVVVKRLNRNKTHGIES
jgi:hypothetical protein